MMNTLAVTEAVPAGSPHKSQDTVTRLGGGWLVAARVAWWLIFGCALGFLATATPALYAALINSASSPTGVPGDVILSRESLAALSQIGLNPGMYATFAIAVIFVRAIPMILAGLLIFWNRSDDWLALVISLAVALSGAVGVAPTFASLPAINPAWIVPTWGIYGVYGALFTIAAVSFPTGKIQPRWMRGLVWVFVFIMLALPVTNWISSAQITLLVALTYGPTILIGIVAQYRSITSVDQRQQVKWAIYALATTLLVAVSLTLASYLPVFTQPGLPQLIFKIVAHIGLAMGTLILGIGFAISILRYRLWDIDLVINRSLVYGALTIILGAIFAGLFLGIQQFLMVFNTGIQTPIALAASAVVIGGLFQPARRRLQTFVDRRFFGLAIGLNQLDGGHRGDTGPGALSGKKLGIYDVKESIGKGGMGEIYRAFQPGLDRAVAIKVLPDHLADHPEFRKRFEREAHIVAGLNHPNIVRVFDFGQAEGITFMVMDYLEGIGLNDALKRSKRLPLDVAQSILNDIASALDHAHSRGLVHRDVKPSNIVLQTTTGAAPRAFLLDFGIAKIIDAHTRLTATGIMGTLDYLAPEQIQSSATVDHRADVYALGVIAFQMLTGDLPFKGSAPQVLFGHLYHPAPDPRDIRPDIPEQVADAIMAALSKNPAERFASAGGFAAALA